MKASHNLYGKKLLQLLILPLLTLSLLSAVNVNIKRVSAVESPYIAVVPGNIVDQNLTPGKNFTVSIYTNYGENTMTEWDVTAYQFTLFYNPNILNGTEVTNGEVIVGGTATFIDGPFYNEAGELSLTVGFYDSTGEVTSMYRPAPWNGTLAYVTFTVVGTGISNITLGPQTKLIGWNFTKSEEYNIIEAKTMPTHIQHGNFNNIRSIHDVAVVSLVAPTTAVLAQLQLVNMSVIVRNEGNFTETFNVTAYANTTEIGTQKITDVTSGGQETLNFSWNITEATEGNYIITANATVLESIGNPTGIDEDPTDSTKTTQITLKAIHDVGITNLVTSQPAVIGPPMLINVTVANKGSYNENVTVTVSYKTVPTPDDTGVVGTKNFTLAKGPTSNTISLSWNTTGLNVSMYEINATATIATDEHLADNTETTRITLALGHDVAIKRISAPTSVDVGELVTIRVQVENLGGYNETFDVEVTYDTSTIEKPKLVTLDSGASKYVEFSWDTTGVAPASYWITAEAILAEGIEDANPDQNLKTHSITVKPPGAIAGTVTDASTGDPIEGANVTVTAGAYSDITDAYGHYNITDVPPGTYTVTASASGYYSNSTSATVISEETTTADLELSPLPGTIAGTVTDASNGEAIIGATVTANGYNATTDAYGHYNITDVPLGTYTVTASATGYESASQTDITVFAEETTTVNFTLRVNSTITISADPTTITVGESIAVSGSIDPTREGVTVTIWYRPTGGTWTTLTTVTTNENSQYSHVWTPETTGTYEVKASWLGDENTSPAESDVQPITVQEASGVLPWYLYVAAAGVTAVIIATIAFYFLKIRKPKPK